MFLTFDDCFVVLHRVLHKVTWNFTNYLLCYVKVENIVTNSSIKPLFECLQKLTLQWILIVESGRHGFACRRSVFYFALNVNLFKVQKAC